MKTIKIAQKQDDVVTAYAEWEDTEENREIIKSWEPMGFEIVEDRYVTGYDGKFYIEGTEPEKPVELEKEEIRNARRLRMLSEADDLKHDYDEALARGDSNSEELKELWLAKKDQIRAELPYPVA